MKTKPLSILTRWAHIFRPSFLKDYVVGKPIGGPWRFWFFWNTVLALCVMGFFGWGISQFAEEGEAWFFQTLPAFELDTETAILTSDDEPQKFSLLEFIEEKVDGTVTTDADDLVIYFDPKEEVYSTENLEDHDASLLIMETGIAAYSKEEGSIIHRFSYEEMLKHSELPTSVTMIDNALLKDFWQSDIKKKLFWVVAGIAFVFVWLWICVFRLLVVVIWAFWAWILSKLMDVPKFGFSDAFLAMLQFGVPLGALSGILMINGVGGFTAFILNALFFLGLVGMNLRELK